MIERAAPPAAALTAALTAAAGPAAPEAPFLKALALLSRANDHYGALDRQSDAVLLAPFLLGKDARKALPIMGDPDLRVLQRLELFWKAVALRVEQRTGLCTTPLLSLHAEGFGRVVLTVGKLLACERVLRDVHRFGFPALEALEREGEKFVEQAVQTIEAYPDVARA